MIKIIQGGIASDNRGQIRFVNDFDMSLVKRFYLIKNSDTNPSRGWRAHKIEKRWFYAISGSFLLSFVKIDDWNCPNQLSEIDQILINSEENKLVYFPPGFGTVFKALEPNSELLVFADHLLDHADKDNYTYPLDYFLKFNNSCY